MTDTKLTNISTTASAANDAIAYVVLDPSGTPDSRAIEVQDLLRLAYGSVHITPASAPSQALVATVPATVQFTTNGGVNLNMTEDAANYRVTAAAAGIYRVTLSLSISGPGGTDLEITPAFGGTSTTESAKTRLESSGYAKSLAVTALINASAGHFTAKIESQTNATVTIEAGSLVVERVA